MKIIVTPKIKTKETFEIRCNTECSRSKKNKHNVYCMSRANNQSHLETIGDKAKMSLTKPCISIKVFNLLYEQDIIGFV